jgi:hypothetical protein
MKSVVYNINILCLGLLFIVLSCSTEEKPQIPENILPEDKIVPLIVDMHLADATLIFLQLDNTQKKFRSDIYYRQIFQKHNITKADFDSSIMYYARIPGHFEKIYDEVLAELNRRNGELTRNDSLKTEEILTP